MLPFVTNQSSQSSAAWKWVALLVFALIPSSLSYAQDADTEESVEVAEQVEGDAELGIGDQWMEIWGNAESSTSDKSQDAVNLIFDKAVALVQPVLFYELSVYNKGLGEDGEPEYVKFPVVLLTLIFGGLIFTFRFAFINVRMFRHSIDVLRGRFDRPEDEGEVTHFQALTSALSATVGLGNISGVALAISLGGAGAVFWMWGAAFFGMSMKFTSCSLAQYYRRVRPDGSVLGGPMVYLEEGIKDRFPALAPLGVLLGTSYAIFTVFAAFGGGNMYQGNQMFEILSTQFGVPNDMAWVVGLVMAIFVGMVIIGGIHRIGEVTSKLVPSMCAFYCLVCCIIILSNFSQVGSMISSIFSEAFSSQAGFGGLLGGAILLGTRRAAFSNEAGLGSASIAHAAAKTDEPIREGIVAMIGPFIDTIVVCTMTALTILITKSIAAPVEGIPGNEGVNITAAAFATLGDWAPKLLCVAVVIFAYSTMISWSYYGEKATEYLFGQRGVTPYRVVFVLFVILGPILSLKSVIDFSDMMLFSMGFPNILGMILLSGVVGKHAHNYIGRLRSGDIKPTK